MKAVEGGTTSSFPDGSASTHGGISVSLSWYLMIRWLGREESVA